MRSTFAKALVATTLIVGGPVGLIAGLQAAGIVDSAWLAAGLGAALSLGLYRAGAWAWSRRAGTGDLLFGELMLWGWAARAVGERRCESAARMVGTPEADGWQAPGDLVLQRRVRDLERLARGLEARDPYTHGHARRVARYSAMIATEMGCDPAEVALIRQAAVLHDVGKVETSLAVLRKPGRLTPEEFAEIQRHPVDGEAMVAGLGEPALSAIVRSHHERLDGTGYPDGLTGAAISRGARIVAVADTFDAITSTRSYRSAKPHAVALDILRSEAGDRLDPDAVAAFLRSYAPSRPTALWLTVLGALRGVAPALVGDLVGGGVRAAVLVAGTAAVGVGLTHGTLVPAPAAAPRSAPAALILAHPADHASALTVTSAGATTFSSTRRTGRVELAGGTGRRTAGGRLADGATQALPTGTGTATTTTPLGATPAAQAGSTAPAPTDGSATTGGSDGTAATGGSGGSARGTSATGTGASAGTGAGSGTATSVASTTTPAGPPVTSTPAGSPLPTSTTPVSVGSSGDTTTVTVAPSPVLPGVGVTVTTGSGTLPGVTVTVPGTGLPKLGLRSRD